MVTASTKRLGGCLGANTGQGVQSGLGHVVDMPVVDGVQHRFVLVDGLQMHYAEAGVGEPIVFLHGWPQHWWSWRHVIGPLSARYRVICPDIRGLGWSEGSTDGYDFDRLAADLIGLLDALKIDRTRLVGHDWGSAIGYAACLAAPERITQYVAVAGLHPWAARGGPIRLWLRLWHIYTLAMLGAVAMRRLRIPEHALRAWRHVGEFTAQEQRTYLHPLRRPSAVIATHRFYRNVVLREIPFYALHHTALRLKTPTLHLLGENDPLTRGVPDSFRRFATDMRIEVIQGCGHFVAEEMPEAFVALLDDFFAG